MIKYKLFMDILRIYELCIILLIIVIIYLLKIEFFFNFFIKSRNIFIYINIIKKKY